MFCEASATLRSPIVRFSADSRSIHYRLAIDSRSIQWKVAGGIAPETKGCQKSTDTGTHPKLQAITRRFRNFNRAKGGFGIDFVGLVERQGRAAMKGGAKEGERE